MAQGYGEFRTINLSALSALKPIDISRKRLCIPASGESRKGRGSGCGEPSIPTYEDQTPAEVTAREAEEVELATWHMLREDPLFELRLLPSVSSKSVAEEDFDPLGESSGAASSGLVSKLVVPPEFTQILVDRELQSYWEPARESFSARGELDSLLLKANRDPREVSSALARGLVASLVNVAILDGHPGFTSETRDRLVELLIPGLGNRPMGPFDWVTDVLGWRGQDGRHV